MKRVRKVTVVIFALCLLSPARASTESSVKRAEMELSQVAADVLAAVRRARYAQAPGTEGAPPNLAELTNLERRLLAAKTDIERCLAQPNYAQTADAETVSPDLKRDLLQNYLAVAQNMVALRIAMQLPHDPAWLASLGAEMPSQILRELPGIIAGSTKNALGTESFSYTLSAITAAKPPRTRIALSETLVQGLELGHLAENPTSDSFLTMVQYLATEQLFENWQQIHFLAPDATDASLPAVPAPLRAKLQSLGVSDTLEREQQAKLNEALERPALVVAYKSIAPQAPVFADAELIRDLGAALGKPGSDKFLATQFQNRARQELSEKLRGKITEANFLFGSLSPAEYLFYLRQFLTEANAEIVSETLADLQGRGWMRIDSAAAAQKLNNRIEARGQSYSAAVSDATLQAWRAAATRALHSLLFKERRDKLNASLLAHAPILADQYAKLTDLSEIDVTLLAQSLEAKLETLRPRAGVKSIFYDLKQQGGFIAARDEYTKLLIQMTDPSIEDGGLVQPERVRAFMSQHDFSPGLHFSGSVSAALAGVLSGHVADGRKKDIQDLLTIGGWMGFFAIYPHGAPTVAELLTDNGSWELYVKAKNAQSLNDNPLLRVKVKGKALYLALTEIAPSGEATPEAIARATPLIDAALQTTRAQILDDIRKIGAAKNLRDIETVVTDSMMLQLVLSAYPEFMVSQDQFVETLLTPSLPQQLVHRYVGTTLSSGFGALMLIQGAGWLIKPASPYAGALLKGMTPLIDGFMKTSLMLMVADTASQISDLRDIAKRSQDTQDLAATDSTSATFVDADQLNNAKGAYQIGQISLVSRLTMDTFFMYAPVGSQIARELGQKISVNDFKGDIKAFQQLGLTPGDWKQVEAVSKAKLALDPAAQAKFDRAKFRLGEKIKSHATWSSAP